MQTVRMALALSFLLAPVGLLGCGDDHPPSRDGGPDGQGGSDRPAQDLPVETAGEAGVDGGSPDAADAAREVRPPSCTVSGGGPGVALSGGGRSLPLLVSAQDYPGVRRVAGLLQGDVARVTGATPELRVDEPPTSSEIVLIGTLGHSPLVDGLVTAGKLDTSGVAGRWDTYLRRPVDDPLPGVGRALVIAGSNKRGTIYGMLDLSAEIGVSPWAYWADVPVETQSDLCVDGTGHTPGEPAVKYRGIFINDEAPALSGWVHAKFGDFNRMFYDKVFELMSRLHANYLWPAMADNAFNEDDALNAALADEYGIVMGTSDREPMMRAQKEWATHGSGDWSFDTNGAALSSFWEQGIRRMGSYESVVTVGMRGNGDLPLAPTTNVDLLRRIITAQRGIVGSVTGRDPAATPQAWVLYKEVQDYYDQGLQVPDDVTVVFADDGWGNVRRLPDAGAATRAGGYGVYYHYDYVGAPRSYKWINTNPLPRIWEQMNLAYRHGVNRLWIVNVGDIKPMELPTQFFMDFAWNPDRWPAESVARYTQQWAAQQFGAANGDAIAKLLDGYAKANARRKPELLDPSTYSLANYAEADRIVADYNQLAADAQRINDTLPPESRDAYYQLVLYPVKAGANLNELYVTAGKNALYAAQGRAATTDLAARVRDLFAADAELTRQYNQVAAAGKWNHMMDQTHIGYTSAQEPATNVMPAVSDITLPATSDMGVAIDGSSGWWPNQSAEAVLPELSPYSTQPAPYIEVFNRGSVPFDFFAEAGETWITLTPALGTINKQTRLTVAVDWQQAPAGARRVPITVHGPNGATVTVQLPVANPTFATTALPKTFFESNGHVAIEADHYVVAAAATGVAWQRVPDLGRTSSAMMLTPVTTTGQTPGGIGTRLEYRVRLRGPGTVSVRADVAPSLNFHGAGLRYAISFDDQTPQTANVHLDTSAPAWEGRVASNINSTVTSHTLASGTDHILKFWAVDAGVVLERLIIDTGGLQPSYLGPPESFVGGRESCSGCARLSVPFVADNTETFFQINLPAATDLTDAVVTFRACVFAGAPQEIVQTYVQDGNAQSFAGRFSSYILLSTIATCGAGFSDLTVTSSASGSFVPSAVIQVGLKINVPAGLTSFVSPTVLYLDSITVSNGVVGPYTFDTSAAPLVINQFNNPVAGSVITWLGP